PSLEDNLPNTVIESILCGTPVIGFPVGGVSDIIRDGFNGLLCENINVDSLVKAIISFFNDILKFDRSKIREDAKKRYDISVSVRNYVNLFKKIYQ
ncbi:unnamed protein product, partial [marine sediment metagenome]